MFAHFSLDFSQQKVRFAQVLAFSKVAKTEGEVFVALWASQGDFEHSRATISPQSPCSLIPVYDHYLVDPLSPMIYANIQPQSILSSKEEDL